VTGAPSAIAIVPNAAEYIDGFHRVLDGVAREHKYLVLLEAPSLPETRQFVLGNIEKGNPMYVALADNEVIGWCDIRREFFASRAHRGTLGMGLAPQWRGRGVGWRLLNAALKKARRGGFTRIELDVFADNARAIALYEKAGFVREGVQRDASLVDGQYRDAILMAWFNRSANSGSEEGSEAAPVLQSRADRLT
jgi:RimJ/RimL family protein N-acetyltransferase